MCWQLQCILCHRLRDIHSGNNKWLTIAMTVLSAADCEIITYELSGDSIRVLTFKMKVKDVEDLDENIQTNVLASPRMCAKMRASRSSRLFVVPKRTVRSGQTHIPPRQQKTVQPRWNG